MVERTSDETRVLLLPPTQRDAAAIEKLLASSDTGCFVCPTIAVLCSAINDGAGAIVVSEESLLADHALAGCLATQPVWSDLPVIVLSRSGSESQALSRVLKSLGNVSVVERPVRVSTFLSIVRSALRARERQYELRTDLALREQLLASERAARAEVERASNMKDEFLATLSHELRNPLNAILGWSQILRTAKQSPEQIDEAIVIIERNARIQTQIIEDLLDMNRIISGKVRLDVQRIDLSTVVRAAIETVLPAAEAKGIRLRSVLDPIASPVSGDPNRLQQVFWNLLSNAVKFTDKGGAVQILLERVNSHLEVSFIDNGEGIDPEFLPHVFDRFRQADATTTRRHGGLGLGLAIVRQLVELHGGSIRAKSPGLGGGSTFVVALPITVVHPEPSSIAERRHPAADSVTMLQEPCVSIAGLKVLIVDDEPDARALLRRLLEDCDVNVLAAASAEDAVRLIQSERPDVLVSDIGMPNEDGYSLIRRVRALAPEHGGGIPAVALTAYARAEDRINAVVAGFQQHLAKPVEPAEFIAIVASLAKRIG